MRGTAVLSLFALLTGCGGGPAPLPIGRISAFFPPGGVADLIEIDATDRLALREAELVGPDGRTTEAQSIVTTPAPAAGVAVALPSGAAFAGNAIGTRPVGGGVQTEGRLLATVSQARIAVPDPAAYRRDWQKYRIRLRFGAPPDAERRELAAPPAPASSGPTP